MSEYVREISHLDPDYLRYEKQCDVVCLNIFGVCTDDMGDADWNFYFTEGYTPIEAIEEAFEYYWSGDMSDGMADHFYHTIHQLKRRERNKCSGE
tara:strand:- start:339 stop:623 length:285 start_codon:yes stop_codon:yes gene_type:complete